MRNWIIALALLLLTNLPADSVWCENNSGIMAFMGDSGKPVDISADKAEGKSLPRGYETIFSGNVKVRQADMTLTCHKLVIVYEQKKGSKARSGSTKIPSGDIRNAENIKTITALGRVEIVQHDTTATAGKAVYDNGKRTVTLSENPRLRQGSNALQANTIVIFLDENRIEFDGGGERIKGRLNPGKRNK